MYEFISGLALLKLINIFKQSLMLDPRQKKLKL